MAYENLDRFYKQRNEEETIYLLCKPIEIHEIFWIDQTSLDHSWFTF